MRKLLAILIIAATILSLAAGCAAGGNNERPEGDPRQNGIVLNDPDSEGAVK